MKHPCIYIISDLEGVGCINTFNDFCLPSGYRNEEACRHLCDEVNALARGCFDGGFSSVIVQDGHGSGGSLREECLDKRIYIQRGNADGFRFASRAYDAIGFVGQHAKAGTPKAQLAHTQTQEAVDFRINGLSVGEYGQLVLSAAEAGIPVLFAAGDLALTKEAEALTPSVRTAAVKEGLCDAPTSLELTSDEVFSCQCAVLHYPRRVVLERIYDVMKNAAVTFLQNPEAFPVSLPISAPYIAQAEYRAGQSRGAYKGFLPARRITTAPHDSIADTLNEFYRDLEWVLPDNDKIVPL